MDNTKLNEILNLSKEDKLQLINDIWDSLNEELRNSEIPEWHKQILDERLKKMENGEATFKNWEEIKRKYL